MLDVCSRYILTDQEPVRAYLLWDRLLVSFAWGVRVLDNIRSSCMRRSMTLLPRGITALGDSSENQHKEITLHCAVCKFIARLVWIVGFLRTFCPVLKHIQSRATPICWQPQTEIVLCQFLFHTSTKVDPYHCQWIAIDFLRRLFIPGKSGVLSVLSHSNYAYFNKHLEPVKSPILSIYSTRCILRYSFRSWRQLLLPTRWFCLLREIYTLSVVGLSILTR